MSIVLKADPKELAEAVREYGVNAPIEHDALAMHATQMEWNDAFKNRVTSELLTRARSILK